MYKKNYETIETPGNGYINDSLWIHEKYGSFLSITSDIPFIREENIRKIIESYNEKSVTGVIKKKEVPEYVKTTSSFQYRGEEVIPTGINVFTDKDERSKAVILDNPKLALNVNTLHDKKTVERILNNEY